MFPFMKFTRLLLLVAVICVHHTNGTFLLYRLLNPIRLHSSPNQPTASTPTQPLRISRPSLYMYNNQRLPLSAPMVNSANAVASAPRPPLVSPVRAGQRLRPQSQPIAVQNYSAVSAVNTAAAGGDDVNNVIESVPIDTSVVGFESNESTPLTETTSAEFVDPLTGVQAHPTGSSFVYGPDSASSPSNSGISSSLDSGSNSGSFHSNSRPHFGLPASSSSSSSSDDHVSSSASTDSSENYRPLVNEQPDVANSGFE